jgi:hypothetical protein
MVVRTAERILVDEEQLQQAIDIVEQTLAEENITADIEVTLDIDPEDPRIRDKNVIVAHIRQPVDADRLVDLIPLLGKRLSAPRLIEPHVPVMFDLVPEW